MSRVWCQVSHVMCPPIIWIPKYGICNGMYPLRSYYHLTPCFDSLWGGGTVGNDPKIRDFVIFVSIKSKKIAKKRSLPLSNHREIWYLQMN